MDTAEGFKKAIQSTSSAVLIRRQKIPEYVDNQSSQGDAIYDMTVSNITNFEISNINGTMKAAKDKVWIWIGNFPINSERVAIAILFTGLLFLFGLIIQSWRSDIKKKRRTRAYRIAQQDLPPTYGELMLRKKPPAYKESLMQVLNGKFVS